MFSLQQGQFAPKFRVEGVAPPTILLVRKLGWMIFYVVYKNVGASFFRFVTIHAFDRQTDGQTDRKAWEIPCVALRAVSHAVENEWDRRGDYSTGLWPGCWNMMLGKYTVVQFVRVYNSGGATPGRARSTALAPPCLLLTENKMLPYLTALFVSFWHSQRRWRPVFWGRRL